METVKEMCGDNRFDVIQRAKEHLIEATNIESSPDEMKVLDSFLFRAWQMGWLRQYEPTLRNATDTKVGDKSSPSDEWVSVDERLPEKQHDWVLAACKLVPEGYYGVPHIAELRNGKWWSDDGKFPLIEIGVKVTHWQPLPKPPKGVQ